MKITLNRTYKIYADINLLHTQLSENFLQIPRSALKKPLQRQKKYIVHQFLDTLQIHQTTYYKDTIKSIVYM